MSVFNDEVVRLYITKMEQWCFPVKLKGKTSAAPDIYRLFYKEELLDKLDLSLYSHSVSFTVSLQLCEHLAAQKSATKINNFWIDFYTIGQFHMCFPWV